MGFKSGQRGRHVFMWREAAGIKRRATFGYELGESFRHLKRPFLNQLCLMWATNPTFPREKELPRH